MSEICSNTGPSKLKTQLTKHCFMAPQNPRMPAMAQQAKMTRLELGREWWVQVDQVQRTGRKSGQRLTQIYSTTTTGCRLRTNMNIISSRHRHQYQPRVTLTRHRSVQQGQRRWRRC